MAGQNAANFGMFKTVYSNRLVEATKRHEGQWNKMDEVQGNTDQYRFFVKLVGTTSLGNLPEGANLRPPKQAITIQPYVGYKQFACNIQITDVLKALAKGDRGSLQAATKMTVNDGLQQSMRYREGAHYLDGTGIVALIGPNPTAGSTTMPVTQFNGGTGGSSPAVNVDIPFGSQAQWDRGGLTPMIWGNGDYDIYSPTGVLRGTVTVTDEDDPTLLGTSPKFSEGQYTIAAPGLPTGVTAGDLVVWSGSFGTMYDGLDNLLDNDTSGTFQGVDMSQPFTRKYTSVVLSNGGVPRVLTQELFIEALQGIFQRTGNSGDENYAADMTSRNLEVLANPTMALPIVGIYQVTASAANSGGALGTNGSYRLQGSDRKLGNGSLTIATPFGDITIRLKNNCQEGRIYFAPYDQLKVVMSRRLDWRPGVDGVFTPSQLATVNTAQLLEVCQPFVEDRRRGAKILDIATIGQNSGN